MIRRLLCALGLHIYGPWQQTRYNPACDFFTDHRHCTCGRSKHRFVRGEDVPEGWNSMALPPGVTASEAVPAMRRPTRRPTNPIPSQGT